MKKVAVLILTIILLVSCGSKKKHASLEKSKNRTTQQLDMNALIQLAMTESYKESVEDLKHQANKIKEYNNKKKALRDELTKIKEKADAQMEMMDYLIKLKSFQNTLQLALAQKAHAKHSRARRKTKTSIIKREMKNSTEKLIKNLSYLYNTESPNIPKRVPRQGIKTLEDLNKEIIVWSNQVGEDGQLQNISLQNALQKKQEILQIMTNILKLSHDTQMSIIRKMK